MTDPEVEHVPVNELLSKEYLASRAKLFDPEKTNPSVVHVSGLYVHSNSTLKISAG